MSIDKEQKAREIEKWIINSLWPKDTDQLFTPPSEEVLREFFKVIKGLIDEGVCGYPHPFSVGYRVICDETNNTQEDIDQGIVNVTIIPPPAANRIEIEIDKVTH